MSRHESFTARLDIGNFDASLYTFDQRGVGTPWNVLPAGDRSFRDEADVVLTKVGFRRTADWVAQDRDADPNRERGEYVAPIEPLDWPE